MPFEQFLKLITKANYYPLFRKLSEYVHPSPQVLRANFTPAGIGQIYHYAPQYDEQKSEIMLNLLYGLMNMAVWEGLVDVLEFAEVPKSLKKYKEMQDEATRCFDKFFEQSSNQV